VRIMVSKTDSSQATTLGALILEEFLELEVQDMSAETANRLLEFEFDAARHDRVSLLSRKAQKGTLSHSEQDELDEYIRVGTVLGILQSRARRALQNVAQAP
jgi:hypothetical protein